MIVAAHSATPAGSALAAGACTGPQALKQCIVRLEPDRSPR